MPPKRSVAARRGPGRPAKAEAQSTSKATPPKRGSKTPVVKSVKKEVAPKATPAKAKQEASVSKATPNKNTCQKCKESFSSVVLFKKHQLTCGTEEKIKTESRKRAADVENDIEIITTKTKKQAKEVDDDVEIIGSVAKKSEDRSKLQTFMSNKVQSLLSSPSRNINLDKAKNTSSLSAFSLRKNIALSMQKNKPSDDSNKPRRGRKPAAKNLKSSDASTAESSANKTSDDDDIAETEKATSLESSKLTLSKAELNKIKNKVALASSNAVAKKPQPSTSVITNTAETILKSSKLNKEDNEESADVVKVPAGRGRPPKKLEQKLKEAAAASYTICKKIPETNIKSIQPTYTSSTSIITTTSTKGQIPEKERERAHEQIRKLNSNRKQRRITKKPVVTKASESQSENDLEIEMEVEKGKKTDGDKISLDVTIKEEEDEEDISNELPSNAQEPIQNENAKSETNDSEPTEDSSDAPKVFSCAVCQKKFTRKYHLDRHLRISRCSGMPLPSFPCELCNRVYTRKDNLREHLRSHAGEVHRRKKHKCPHCDKAFHGQSLLAIHIRKHTGERPFSCDFCPKKFSSAGALSKHRMTHTGERPYSCNECGRRFTLKGTLSRHLRTHTGIRPHTCPYCGKKFIQIGGLNAHLFYHTGENGFKCEDCGKIFNRKARLQMHQLYVHIKLKPYACEHCTKTFTRKEDLMRHSVLHTGEKPFKCPTCDRRFSVKPSLKLHLLTHTKEEPRSCHECGRAFIRKDCLLRHMRKRHRDVFDKILFDEKDEKDANIVNSRVLSEKDLTDNIKELLYLLIDEPTLVGFGWPHKPVDEVLELVIQRCGHTPVTRENYDHLDRLRENAKLLFTVVIDDNAVKTLLNNQTVDEVILHVLRLAKT